MKFKFSLEALLKAKEIKVNLIQKELAEILKQNEILKGKIQEVEKNLYECRDIYIKKCNKGDISADEILNFQTYFSSEEIKRKRILEELEKQFIKEKETREKLAEINKEKKGIEKLKEKEFEAFIKELEQREIKELDEISSGRFARKAK